MADLWGSSRSGLKGGDLQFWAPLEFEERADLVREVRGRRGEEGENVAETVAVPRPVRWVDSFELDLPGPINSWADESEEKKAREKEEL
ncbi:MAG: hypothetical protein SGPRY_013430 [Prymnesium sp.]